MVKLVGGGSVIDGAKMTSVIIPILILYMLVFVTTFVSFECKDFDIVYFKETFCCLTKIGGRVNILKM